jgi:hypothetical protein
MSYYSDIFSPEDVCVPKTVEITKNKFTLTEMKKANNDNFCTIKLQLNKKWKGHYLRLVTISYYKTSPQSGARIIHAITGDELQGLVGSLAEDKYFKVKMSAYSESNNGNVFYLSPTEYENHQYCELNQATIDKWNAKQ